MVTLNTNAIIIHTEMSIAIIANVIVGSTHGQVSARGVIVQRQPSRASCGAATHREGDARTQDKWPLPCECPFEYAHECHEIKILLFSVTKNNLSI